MEKQDLKDYYRYNIVKRKVRNIKAFYTNLGLYCICMPIIIAVNIFVVPGYQWFWFSLICWGIGVMLHGISTFQLSPFLGKDWENEKLQEFIEDEIENNKNK